MDCRKLTEVEIIQIYHNYMEQDFPSSELKPLSHILRSMEAGFGFSLGIFDGGELAGYAVFIICEETNCALLDYFAILADRRGKGTGHSAFSLFKTYFKEHLAGVEGLYIESERVSAAENEKQRLIRERRIAFYLSCGCEMTTLRAVLFGVDYSVLYKPFEEQPGKAVAGRGNQPLGEALDALYQKMFKPEHYARFVSLTEAEESNEKLGDTVKLFDAMLEDRKSVV